MDLLRELTVIDIDHVPIMEALASLEYMIESLNENTRGGKVNLKGTAANFMKANPAMVIGAAALAVGAYAQYKRNKRDTVTLHAKDAYERKMITSIVDVMTKDNKFRVVRTKFSGGGKSWVLKRVGI